MAQAMGVEIEVAFSSVEELSATVARIVSLGWISDEAKVQRIADSDGRTPAEVQRDGATGMIGEWNGYFFVPVACSKPDCRVLTRDQSIWGKDLLLLEDIKVFTANAEIKAVERSVSCKAQLLSQTRSIRDTEPSWLFQLPGTGHDGYTRYGDPMLLDGALSKLLIVSWVDDRWTDDRTYVHHPKPGKAYKKGFCWTSQVSCFWWPDVYPYLSEPRVEKLLGLKKALYWKDIKHLQSEIVTSDMPKEIWV